MEKTSNKLRDGLHWSSGRVAVSTGAARKSADSLTDRMGIMGEVRMVGGALVLILLMVFVLTEIYNSIEFETDADGNYESPFGTVIEDLEGIGATALGLLVIALLVVSASAIMRFFGQSGFGGGR